ncbi:MAG TPA: hypothetical protein VGA02_08635 [Gemmatimonadales bacterium]|jgi:hypothetical protein
MLEPQLDHHRRQFEQLGRRQRLLVLGTPLLAAVLLVTLALTSAPDWTDFLLVVLVFLVISAIAVLEIQRVLVFRRDLKERMGGATDGPVSTDHGP